VNDRLQTSNPDVFAAGDVCGEYQFTHAADAMARVVVRNALSLGRSRFTTDQIPWCTYTFPEVAHVGPGLSTLQQRAANGSRKDQFRTFREDLQRVDRGVLDDAGTGFLKVHVAGNSDRILAATLVSPHAGETIGEIVAAMKYGVGLGKLSSVVRPYPTQAEILKRVSDAYNRERLTPLLRRLLRTWLWWLA
jgi:pyruvate/2-oxoglutarate dehydrogenase complex dihydrolipoamide dehydrogenase (E3) component